MDLSEKTLTSKQVFGGKLLKVFRDEVELPDGRQSVREWIDHPGAAAVVPVTAAGRVILIRQYRYSARDTFIEIPAGKLEGKQETPRELAERELREETGWRVGELTPVGALRAAIGYTNEVIHCFVGTELTSGEREQDADEFIEVFDVDFDEAVEMVLRGDITDMKTAACLTLVNAQRDRFPELGHGERS